MDTVCEFTRSRRSKAFWVNCKQIYSVFSFETSRVFPYRRYSNRRRRRTTRMKTSTKVVQLLFSLLIVILCGHVDAKKKRKRRPMESLNDFFAIISSTYLLVFAPVVIIFVYNVVKDPAFPLLVDATWKAFKARTVAYLGGTSHEVHDSAIRRKQTKRSSSSGLRRRQHPQAPVRA